MQWNIWIFKFSSCFISDLKHMAQTYKTLSQTSYVALQKEYATTSVKMNKWNIKKWNVCLLFYRGSYTKRTSFVKISYCNINLHTINILTTVRFLKLVWFVFLVGKWDRFAGFIMASAFWWCSCHVITSLQNFPMATGENGCSCVK